MKTTLLLLCTCVALIALSTAFSRHATAAPGKAISAPLAETMSSHGIDTAQTGSDGDAVTMRPAAYTVGAADTTIGTANP